MTADPYAALATLLHRLEMFRLGDHDVIAWGSPVLSFGDLRKARIATVGINPSYREFVDEKGEELSGKNRRFHTLRSLNLTTWQDADSRHLEQILDACSSYFRTNPYDRWFRKLEHLVQGAGATFYGDSADACHLDLIPYATAHRWAQVDARRRRELLRIAGDTLGDLLRGTSIELLILNGRQVVGHFQEVADVALDSEAIPSWALPRRNRRNVRGVGFRGEIDSLGGERLGHKVVVLGYNHNLQSSFGVTAEVVGLIRSWVAQASAELAR